METTTDPKLLPVLERLAELARDKGASDVELLDARWQARSVEVRRGQAADVQVMNGAVLRGRVHVDGAKSASFSTKDPSAARDVITKAMARAHKGKPDNAQGPSEAFPISERGVGLDDRRYDVLSDRDRTQVALDGYRGCKGDRVICHSTDYTDVRTFRAFYSTRGISTSSSDTRYDVRIQASLDDQSLSTELQAAGRAFASIGALPYGLDLAERLQGLSAATVPLPPTEDAAIVLEPYVLASLLTRLAPAFCADAVLGGRSFLSKLKGTELGSYRVHLIDDATLHGALLTRAFDDRGVAPMPVPLIQEGQLGGLLHTPETARAEDARPTGHEMDGNLCPSNLILRRGNRSRTQMLGEVPLALQFDRLDGDLDLKTGMLELYGPAFILESGKRRGLVRRAVLRGHILELLKGVKELASNQQRTLNVDCATAVITGFPVFES